MSTVSGSALERFAARLIAQRAYLAEAARLIASIPGPVFEIGLGKGRTYDHLRRLLPGRAIYCFDREHHAPPEESPPAEFLVLGEIQSTLPALAKRLGTKAALAHCDIGTRKPARDMEFARYLAAALPEVMAPGGIVIGDRPMESISINFTQILMTYNAFSGTEVTPGSPKGWDLMESKRLP